MPSLVVFLKWPEPGKVKTRLAADIGDVRAAQLYHGWIGQVLTAIQPVRPNTRVIGYFDGAPANRFTEWGDLVDDWVEQPSGDLGHRLDAAFRQFPPPIIAIGTDCLTLHARHIDDSLRSLESSDVVFGPAIDGGYYLVAARTHWGGLFDHVRWSSEETLKDHVTRCRSLGLSVSLLEMMSDIDNAADLPTS